MRHAVISPTVLVLFALAAPAAAQPGSDFGTVSVSVRPRIADVFIDGDRWVSPESSGPLVVQLAPGRHSVDVRAPGYRPFSTVVEIRRGESTPLNVSLSAGDTPPPFGERPPPPPPGQPGPIRQISVQPSGDGFVFAPDFKIAEMNDRTTGFAGFYGGRVFAGRVMIGGGAYFQLDDYPSEQMVYGGLVTEFRLVRARPVGVTLHGLAGYGATNLPIFGHHGGYNNGPPMRITELRVRLRLLLRLSLRRLLHRRARGAGRRAFRRQRAPGRRHRVPLHVGRRLQVERGHRQHQLPVRALTAISRYTHAAPARRFRPASRGRRSCASRFERRPAA